MSRPHDTLRSPAKRTRGLGSAHHGTGHWWLQRMTAIALIPLSVWFMIQLITQLIGADAIGISLWLKNPVNAVAMVLFTLAMFIHARLGVQVIIEDYVHNKFKKTLLLLFINAVALVAGLACIFSILRLHFIGV
jgi:succinate dehydrogenase / fumarate reductase membrane anchor subunit